MALPAITVGVLLVLHSATAAWDLENEKIDAGDEITPPTKETRKWLTQEKSKWTPEVMAMVDEESPKRQLMDDSLKMDEIEARKFVGDEITQKSPTKETGKSTPKDEMRLPFPCDIKPIEKKVVTALVKYEPFLKTAEMNAATTSKTAIKIAINGKMNPAQSLLVNETISPKTITTVSKIDIKFPLPDKIKPIEDKQINLEVIYKAIQNIFKFLAQKEAAEIQSPSSDQINKNKLNSLLIYKPINIFKFLEENSKDKIKSSILPKTITLVPKMNIKLPLRDEISAIEDKEINLLVIYKAIQNIFKFLEENEASEGDKNAIKTLAKYELINVFKFLEQTDTNSSLKNQLNVLKKEKTRINEKLMKESEEKLILVEDEAESPREDEVESNEARYVEESEIKPDISILEVIDENPKEILLNKEKPICLKQNEPKTIDIQNFLTKYKIEIPEKLELKIPLLIKHLSPKKSQPLMSERNDEEVEADDEINFPEDFAESSENHEIRSSFLFRKFTKPESPKESEPTLFRFLGESPESDDKKSAKKCESNIPILSLPDRIKSIYPRILRKQAVKPKKQDKTKSPEKIESNIPISPSQNVQKVDTQEDKTPKQDEIKFPASWKTLFKNREVSKINESTSPKDKIKSNIPISLETFLKNREASMRNSSLISNSRKRKYSGPDLLQSEEKDPDSDTTIMTSAKNKEVKSPTKNESIQKAESNIPIMTSAKNKAVKLATKNKSIKKVESNSPIRPNLRFSRPLMPIWQISRPEIKLPEKRESSIPIMSKASIAKRKEQKSLKVDRPDLLEMGATIILFFSDDELKPPTKSDPILLIEDESPEQSPKKNETTPRDRFVSNIPKRPRPSVSKKTSRESRKPSNPILRLLNEAEKKSTKQDDTKLSKRFGSNIPVSKTFLCRYAQGKAGTSSESTQTDDTKSSEICTSRIPVSQSQLSKSKGGKSRKNSEPILRLENKPEKRAVKKDDGKSSEVCASNIPASQTLLSKNKGGKSRKRSESILLNINKPEEKSKQQDDRKSSEMCASNIIASQSPLSNSKGIKSRKNSEPILRLENKPEKRAVKKDDRKSSEVCASNIRQTLLSKNKEGKSRKRSESILLNINKPEEKSKQQDDRKSSEMCASNITASQSPLSKSKGIKSRKNSEPILRLENKPEKRPVKKDDRKSSEVCASNIRQTLLSKNKGGKSRKRSESTLLNINKPEEKSKQQDDRKSSEMCASNITASQPPLSKSKGIKSRKNSEPILRLENKPEKRAVQKDDRKSSEVCELNIQVSQSPLSKSKAEKSRKNSEPILQLTKKPEDKAIQKDERKSSEVCASNILLSKNEGGKSRKNSEPILRLINEPEEKPIERDDTKSSELKSSTLIEPQEEITYKAGILTPEQIEVCTSLVREFFTKNREIQEKYKQKEGPKIMKKPNLPKYRQNTHENLTENRSRSPPKDKRKMSYKYEHDWLLKFKSKFQRPIHGDLLRDNFPYSILNDRNELDEQPWIVERSRPPTRRRGYGCRPPPIDIEPLAPLVLQDESELEEKLEEQPTVSKKVQFPISHEPNEADVQVPKPWWQRPLRQNISISPNKIGTNLPAEKKTKSSEKIKQTLNDGPNTSEMGESMSMPTKIYYPRKTSKSTKTAEEENLSKNKNTIESKTPKKNISKSDETKKIDLKSPKATGEQSSKLAIKSPKRFEQNPNLHRRPKLKLEEPKLSMEALDFLANYELVPQSPETNLTSQQNTSERIVVGSEIGPVLNKGAVKKKQKEQKIPLDIIFESATFANNISENSDSEVDEQEVPEAVIILGDPKFWETHKAVVEILKVDKKINDDNEESKVPKKKMSQSLQHEAKSKKDSIINISGPSQTIHTTVSEEDQSPQKVKVVSTTKFWLTDKTIIDVVEICKPVLKKNKPATASEAELKSPKKDDPETSEKPKKGPKPPKKDDSKSRKRDEPKSTKRDKPKPSKDKSKSTKDDESQNGDKQKPPNEDTHYSPKHDESKSSKDSLNGAKPKLPKGNDPKSPKDEESKSPKDDEPIPPNGDKPKLPKGNDPKLPKDDEPISQNGDKPKLPKGNDPKLTKDDEPISLNGDKPKLPKENDPKLPKDDESKSPKEDEPNSSEVRLLNLCTKDEPNLLEEPKVSVKNEPQVPDENISREMWTPYTPDQWKNRFPRKELVRLDMYRNPGSSSSDFEEMSALAEGNPPSFWPILRNSPHNITEISQLYGNIINREKKTVENNKNTLVNPREKLPENDNAKFTDESVRESSGSIEIEVRDLPDGFIKPGTIKFWKYCNKPPKNVLEVCALYGEKVKIKKKFAKRRSDLTFPVAQIKESPRYDESDSSDSSDSSDMDEPKSTFVELTTRVKNELTRLGLKISDILRSHAQKESNVENKSSASLVDSLDSPPPFLIQEFSDSLELDLAVEKRKTNFSLNLNDEVEIEEVPEIPSKWPKALEPDYIYLRKQVQKVIEALGRRRDGPINQKPSKKNEALQNFELAYFKRPKLPDNEDEKLTLLEKWALARKNWKPFNQKKWDAEQMKKTQWQPISSVYRKVKRANRITNWDEFYLPKLPKKRNPRNIFKKKRPIGQPKELPKEETESESSYDPPYEFKILGTTKYWETHTEAPKDVLEICKLYGKEFKRKPSKPDVEFMKQVNKLERSNLNKPFLISDTDDEIYGLDTDEYYDEARIEEIIKERQIERLKRKLKVKRIRLARLKNNLRPRERERAAIKRNQAINKLVALLEERQKKIRYLKYKKGGAKQIEREEEIEREMEQNREKDEESRLTAEERVKANEFLKMLGKDFGTKK